MAKVRLDHGKNPDPRKLSGAPVAGRESEIAVL